MKILTISFSPNGKKYDYLMRNKGKFPVRVGETIAVVDGISRKGVECYPIQVLSSRSVDSLPSHVTSILDVVGDRQCALRRMTKAEASKLIAAADEAKPVGGEGGWERRTITKEDVIRAFGERWYYALPFEKKLEIESGKASFLYR